MDAALALAELTEISPLIELAVVFDSSGEPLVSSLEDAGAARSLAERGVALLARADEAAAALAIASGRGAPSQIEVSLADSNVLVVREGELSALAIAAADAVAGLVFFDLQTCLRKIAGIEPKARRLRVLKRKEGEREEGGGASGAR